EENDWVSQPFKQQNPNVQMAAAQGVGVLHVSAENVHREVGQTGEHRNHRAPAKEPQRGQQQIGIDSLLRVSIELFLQRDINEIEEIQKSNPRYSGHEVKPTKYDVCQLIPAG